MDCNRKQLVRGVGWGWGGERETETERGRGYPVIAIAVTGHLRPSFYTHPVPPRLLVPMPPPPHPPFILFYCFSLLYYRLSDQHWLLLFSAPILVRWICQMFYCLICWLYAHTCITEWCMHCLHPALWTRKVWFRSYCAPCINFHILNLTHSFMPICI